MKLDDLVKKYREATGRNGALSSAEIGFLIVIAGEFAKVRADIEALRVAIERLKN